MRISRFIGLFLVAVASSIGALVFLGVISNEKVQAFPLWLRMAIALCLFVFVADIVFGLIGDYRRIRRQRREGTANDSD